MFLLGKFRGSLFHGSLKSNYPLFDNSFENDNENDRKLVITVTGNVTFDENTFHLVK